MTSALRTTKAGLEFIKAFEGFRARATRLPDGRWTIGHGHVRSAREGVRISRDDAEALLIYDLRKIEAEIDDLLLSPLDENQYDALVSFVYNISAGQFRQSEVLRLINRGDHTAAAFAMEAWRKARINGKLQIVDALVRRRAAEKAMFLQHPTGPALCPTPLIAPEFDAGWRQSLSPDARAEDPDAEAAPIDQFDGPDVNAVANAVEALARKTQDVPTPEPAVSRAAPAKAANDDLRPRADEDAEAELRDRISRVLAREEAAVETREKAASDAPRPAASPEAEKKDAGAPVQFRTVPASSPAPTSSGPTSSASTSPSSTPISSRPVRDAFDLSSDPDAAEDVLSAPYPAFEEVVAARNGVDHASKPVVVEPPFKPAAIEARDRPNGKTLWGAAIIGAFGLMAWGLVDFLRAAGASEDVTRQQVVFGPMVFLLGLLLSLIAVYYFFVRKDDPELI